MTGHWNLQYIGIRLSSYNHFVEVSRKGLSLHDCIHHRPDGVQPLDCRSIWDPTSKWPESIFSVYLQYPTRVSLDYTACLSVFA